MNYIKVNDNRYNLTDNGINKSDALTLQFKAEGRTFESVKSDFESVKDITVYGTEGNEDFISGYFENITLKSIEYDLKEELYTVTMSEIDETAQRINDLEKTVNYLLLGGEQ